jgi:hypothetical protein
MVIEENVIKSKKHFYERNRIPDGKAACNKAAFNTADILSQTGLQPNAAQAALKNWLILNI